MEKTAHFCTGFVKKVCFCHSGGIRQPVGFLLNDKKNFGTLDLKTRSHKNV